MLIIQIGSLSQSRSFQDNLTKEWIYIDVDEDPIYIYACPIVGLLGCILNILTLIIFLDKQFKENLYRFLRIESIYIIINLFITCLRPLYFCKSKWLSKYFATQLYYIYLLFYLASVLEMTALLTHVLATFDFYALISNIKIKCLSFLEKKIIFKLNVVGTFLLSCLMYSYQLFMFDMVSYQILEVDLNQTVINQRIIYESKPNEFYNKSIFKKAIEMFVSIYRDGILLSVLIILNILIYFQVIKTLRNKKMLLNTNANNNQQILNSSSSTNRASAKAHNKMVLMVLIGSTNVFLGRIPILIDFILRNLIKNHDMLNKLAVLAVYVSYSINFFLYYYTNLRFRNVFNQYSRKLITLIPFGCKF